MLIGVCACARARVHLQGGNSCWKHEQADPSRNAASDMVLHVFRAAFLWPSGWGGTGGVD